MIDSSNAEEKQEDNASPDYAAARSNARIVPDERRERRKHASLKQRRKEKRNSLINEKFWEKEEPCCKSQCCQEYNHVLVYRFRKYWITLSDTNQRCFVNDRLKKKEMDADEDVPEDFTNRKVNQGFRMEKPEILAKLLGLHEATKLQVLPKPREEDTMYMCNKFFLHMIQRSVSWLYPHTKKDNAR